jgi:predicted DNA-binding transcriptional regulator YafY
MGPPTLRVLKTLELLQARGRIGGAELAERLGVDRRTVRRYIARLEELGIPVTSELGRDGAYMLVAGFKLPPMMFTDDEALAVAVGLLASRQLGLAESGPAMASAQAKLERVMPRRLQQRVRAINDTVALEFFRPAADLDPAVLITLTTAAQSQQRVRLQYSNARGEFTERDFDAYGLAYRIGRWYVAGMCRLRGDLRCFRLDRVQSVVPLEVEFTRPRNFNALEYLKMALSAQPAAHPVEVLLETDLLSAQRALYYAASDLEWVGDGVLFRCQVEDLDWFARELARLPFDMIVREPQALRAALARRGAELARIATRHPNRGPDLP